MTRATRRVRRPLIESLESRRLLSATLFKDIVPPVGAGSSPKPGITVDNVAYFVANTYELWRSDGTDAGTSLVAQVSGPGSGLPSSLVAFDHKVYFFVGFQLWSSDGTPGGTTVLKDFDPGPGVDPAFNVAPGGLTVSGGTLYFGAAQGLSSVVNKFGDTVTANINGELWKTDGTPDGTVQVADINPGIDHGSAPTALADVNGTLYFAAVGPTLNQRLPYKSNGTPETTVRITDRETNGPFINSPRDFTYAGGTIFFTARTNTDDNTRGLYTTDGTADNTHYVGLAGSFPTGLLPFGDRVVFQVSGGGSPIVSDGTPAGTHGITAGYTDNVQSLAVFDNLIYFRGSAASPDVGIELWVSDGSPASATVILDAMPGPASSSPVILGATADSLYVAAKSPDLTTKLYRIAAGSPPTAYGPLPATPVGPIAAIGSTFLFSATDDANGGEPWLINPSTHPTPVLLKDLNPSTVYNVSSNPSNPVLFNGALYFTAGAPGLGTELFRSDGTPAGTQMLVDLAPGSASSSIANLTPVGNTLFFTANLSTGTELYKTDGTAAETSLLVDFNTSSGSNPQSLTPFNGFLYFFALADSGWGLFKSDGTAAGTALVRSLSSNGSFTPNNLTVLGNTLYFTAWENATGYELWKSDGTTGGTARAADVFPGATSSSPSSLTPFNGALYFAATGSGTGVELWKFDGTNASLVANLNPGSASSSPAGFRAVGNTLYFAATTAATGRELFQTDGTTASLVFDINPGTASSNPANLTAYNGALYFSATDPANLQQIWTTSPATPTSATRFTDLHPKAGSSLANPTAVVGGLLYFFGIDAAGQKLFVTDGDPAHTADAAFPGFAAFLVNLLISHNGQIFASGFDANYGVELFTITPPITPPALTITSGTYTLTTDFVASSLSISPGATLDLAGHSLFINYAPGDPSPADSVRNLLLTGQIISTTSPAGSRVAYVDPTLLPEDRRPAGSDASSLLLLPALTGDANLDGALSADDFALYDKGARVGASTWTFGDFNYDGIIDAQDHQLLTSAYNAAHPPAPAAEALAPSSLSPGTSTPDTGTLPAPVRLTVTTNKSPRRNKVVTLTLRPKAALARTARITYAVDFNGDGIIDQTLTARADRPLTLRHAYKHKGAFNLTVRILSAKRQLLGTHRSALVIR